VAEKFLASRGRFPNGIGCTTNLASFFTQFLTQKVTADTIRNTIHAVQRDPNRDKSQCAGARACPPDRESSRGGITTTTYLKRSRHSLHDKRIAR